MFYPEELIEEIRNSNDIISVIGSYLKLQKKGSNYMGLCPFHNEKTPSFSVSQQKQMYYCFGCGAGGNVYTFIMEYENFTFIEAVRHLAERVSIQLPEQDYSDKARRNADLRSKLLEVHKEAGKYYYYQLKTEEGQVAYKYLIERGLEDEIIKQFGIDYANRYSDDLYRYLKKRGYDDQLLKQSGLISYNEKRGAFDKFWDRIIFPIMDINNRVIGFGGRIMKGLGENVPKYLNSPETIIFDKSRNLYGLNFARKSREDSIIICEGYTDTIALHQAGFTNAVASLGTAFTPGHANLLKRYVKEVLLTFDSDEAGTKAALKAISILKDANISVKIVNLSPHKDPDDFIKALGKDEFRKRVDNARNSFFFEIDILQMNYDLSDPEQKTRFFDSVAKKLTGFSEELEREFYIDAVAKEYMIDGELLRRLVNKFGAQMIVEASARPEKSRENHRKRKNRQEDGIIKSQQLLLSWLIEKPELYDKLKDFIDPDDFTEGIYNELAKIVFDLLSHGKPVVLASLVNYFQSVEKQTEVARLLSDESHIDMSQKAWEKALSDTVFRIKENSLDKQSLKAIEANNTKLLQSIIMKKANLKKKDIKFTNE